MLETEQENVDDAICKLAAACDISIPTRMADDDAAAAAGGAENST